MKRRSVVAAGLSALLAPLLTAADCKEGGGSGRGGGGGAGKTRDPNAPPEPWSARDDLNDKIKVVTISAWVDREHGPYYVKMHATDHDTGEQTEPNRHPDDDPRGERVAGGQQFRFTLAYPTHHRVELEIKLTASKPGSTDGYIATRDGKRLHRSTELNGQLQTSLNIWTER